VLDVAGPNAATSNKLDPEVDLGPAMLCYVGALRQWGNLLKANHIVFKPDGEPYRRIVYSTLDTIFERAGIPPFRFHNFKAMALAAYLAGGLGAPELSATTRTSVETIMRHYNGAGSKIGRAAVVRVQGNLFGDATKWDAPEVAPDEGSLAAVAAGRAPDLEPELRRVIELINQTYAEHLARRAAAAAPQPPRRQPSRAAPFRAPQPGLAAPHGAKPRRLSQVVLAGRAPVSDAEFAFLSPHLSFRGEEAKKRAVLDGAILVARSGMAWRALDDVVGQPFGLWDTAHGAHSRWAEEGGGFHDALAALGGGHGLDRETAARLKELLQGLIALRARPTPSARPVAIDPRRTFIQLSDGEWAVCAPVVGAGAARRGQLDGLLWRAETGGRWVDLPSEYGRPEAVRWRGAVLADDEAFAQFVDALAAAPCAPDPVGPGGRARLAKRLRALAPCPVVGTVAEAA
jgi:transposase